jgi:ArsR family transcriptional regulator
MAAVFKALGSPPRLRLLAAIQATPDGEACVCHLVDFVRLTQSTVSHHLSVLADVGLVRREQRGAWAWYTLMPESLDAVRELLAIPGDLAR